MPDATERPDALPKEKTLGIDFNVPEELPTIYANQALVHIGDFEVYLIFQEQIPPLIIGSPEQVKEQIDRLEKVKRQTLVRIAFPKANLGRLIRALSVAQAQITKAEQQEEEQ